MKKRTYFIILLSTLFCMGNAFAASQDKAAISKAVHQFVTKILTPNPLIRSSIEIGQLDPRLQLANCTDKLQLSTYSASKRGNRLSVAVKCEGAKQWTVYVPVSIINFGKVLVADQGIRKGASVESGSLQWVEHQLDRISSGYFLQVDQVEHMIARKHIRRGTVIAPHHLTLPHMIKKGQNVTITADIGGIQVKMNGEALGNGVEGDVIKVSNKSSKRTIQAEVIRPGVVKVRL